MKNETRQDAYERVLDARTGSLTSPTMEYLMGLREQVGGWLDRIEVEIKMRNAAAIRQAEDARDQEEAQE